jgi:uncharacterized membrane protein
MEFADRFFAVFAYIPVLGWIFVLLFKRHSPLPMFHIRQSIGMVVFLVAAFAAWAAGTWVLGWIPFGFMVGVSMFTMVIIAFIFVIVTWIINALKGRMVLLPLFGTRANNIRF